MLKYVVRRFLQMIPVIFLVSVAVFVLNHYLPGDAALAILGEDLAFDDEAYAKVRADLRLDDPLPLRYVHWLGNVARGDFGVSYRNGEDIRPALLTRLPRTLELTALAMAVSIGIGVPIGTLSALRPNSRFDFGGRVFAIAGVAIPDFWLGLLLIYFLAFVLHLFPGTGYVSPSEDLWRNLKLMALPAFTLGTGGAAILMRQTRSALLEVLEQDYIRTARAKGLPNARVVIVHAMKNAVIPVVTLIGLDIGRLFGGAVITETVFNIPGIGRWAGESIFFRDFSAIQAVVLLMTAGVLVSSFVTDVIYSYLDPRIRLSS